MSDRTSDSQPAAPCILIIKRSSLGDITHALPVANALRDTYPDAHIAWLVESRFAEILDNHPALTEVITIRHCGLGEPLGLIRETARVRAEMLKRRFDWALDLQGLLKSAYLLRLSGAQRRIGLAQERREFNQRMCNELAPGPADAHAVLRCLQMAKHLGCDVSNPRFDLPVEPAARDWADRILSEADFGGRRPLVGINPAASSVHKQWPPDRFAALTDMMPEVSWVILGGPGDVALAQGIAAQTASPHIVTAGRTDLKQLVALISRLDALVTADTGPMHVAAALGVPTVALFGPTNPAYTGPFGDIHTVISHIDRCSDRRRSTYCKRTPTCRDYACMNAITPDEVAAALTETIRTHANLSQFP